MRTRTLRIERAACSAVFLLACSREAPDQAALRARVEAIAADDSQQRDRLRSERANLDELRRWTTRLSVELSEAESAFLRAGGSFEQAETTSVLATAQGERAIESFRAAERAYRASSTLIIAAAAADFVGHQLCEGAMSTREYRRQLRSQGIDIDGMDVDHLWPHSRGGANHPLNYQLTEQSLNRSMGNSIAQKFVHQPIGVLRGFAVSGLMRLQCAAERRAFGR